MTFDFGNALGGLLSATQALLNGADADPVLRREFLRGMEINLRRLQYDYENWILGQIMRRGKLKSHKRNIPAGEWLNPIAARWQRLLPEKGLHWNLALQPDLSVLHLDVGLMDRALGNLLYGAILSAIKDSTVRFSARVIKDGRLFRIEIGYSGHPLPQEAFQALPDLPEWGNYPLTDQGLKLGLAVAHHIISGHGGEQKLTPAVNGASRMIIDLPLYQPARF